MCVGVVAASVDREHADVDDDVAMATLGKPAAAAAATTTTTTTTDAAIEVVALEEDVSPPYK